MIFLIIKWFFTFLWLDKFIFCFANVVDLQLKLMVIQNIYMHTSLYFMFNVILKNPNPTHLQILFISFDSIPLVLLIIIFVISKMNIFNVDHLSFFMSSNFMLNYYISNVNLSIAPRFATSMLIKTMNLLGVIWFNT